MRRRQSPIYSYSLRAACSRRDRTAAWVTVLPIALLAAGPASATSPTVAKPSPPLEEIIVTASLRERLASDTPASITVLGQETLRSAGLQHFADVLGMVPNLNWSGGTSRPRFFQLRGVGELDSVLKLELSDRNTSQQSSKLYSEVKPTSPGA